jgi:hypothetical protein
MREVRPEYHSGLAGDDLRAGRHSIKCHTKTGECNNANEELERAQDDTQISRTIQTIATSAMQTNTAAEPMSLAWRDNS